ncbi:CapA family protein [Globicatella sulfidifaciens]|uniref:Capsule synthesis protein PGA_cap n=1 Tax=Globicatella sulfidifaciens DSM 15739 TaxID=1121925 RepID=A0A1T4NSL4_9LACT|nr:CapA family protein [Globicatella sulfidifaciens]SJZ81688.1 capsule synthesis protein PGA_cap [Globicatella sulfidifaciens DSM 15739]
MKILFLGDLLYDYNTINDDIEKLSEFIKQNEYYTVVNLEAPLKSNEQLKKWINLANSNLVVDVLKKLNVVAVNLANNHILDWGPEGLNNLIKALKNNNITYFGAGMNTDEAQQHKVITLNGKKIGFIGAGWDVEMCVYSKRNKAGVAPLSNKKLSKQIEEMRNEVDYSIVNLHWGYEYELYPLPVHRRLAHNLVDIGADIIIGHHAHIVQAYELYKGRSIFYGLGNFYFGSRRELFNQNKNNRTASIFSRYGLGVCWDVENDLIENIYFCSENSQTIICEPFELEDISDIPMMNYNRFFANNRTSTRKPSLYMGRFNSILNYLKVKKFNSLLYVKKKIKQFINR